MKIVWIVLLSCIVNVAVASDLKPFTSDGCSVFPDGTLKEKDLWLSCCIEHDRAYWLGGTHKEKKRADVRLEKYVVGIGEPFIATLMKAGVRIGGSPYFPTPLRWGYGWAYSRGYAPLTELELKTVERVLSESESEMPHLENIKE
ncbi:putative helicase [hydrothermal vent metagenome]|uniref:Putative helicase n=1 Tax=hydrothermal vent metagenome TaxID=652676 RepID=A0A3B0ZER9_9ZZZZ